MKTQEVWNFMRQEWNQALHGLTDQWNHFRQRMNHALVQFNGKEETTEDMTHAWGVVPVCMKERGNKLMVSVEIPGVELDDLTVTLENHALVIRGQNKPRVSGTMKMAVGILWKLLLVSSNVKFLCLID